MIRPDGWEIPSDVTAIHGITNEMAFEHGIDEGLALEGFMEIWRRAGLRVAQKKRFSYTKPLPRTGAPKVCPSQIG
jgi:hypothetical protein